MKTLKLLPSVGRTVLPFSLLVCWATVSAQTATLQLSSSSAARGATVNVPLSYTSNGAQAAGVQWTFSYPQTDFSSVNVSTGPSASAAGKTVTCNSASPGQYACVAFGQNQNLIADGVVATATLTVAA